MVHTGANDVGAGARPVADELEVQNLVDRLARLADGDDVDAYVACFVADGRWEHPSAPRRGHDDLRAGRLARVADGTVGPGSGTQHVVTTIAVQLDGDRATARSTWRFVTGTNGTPTIASTGTYDDECTRTDEGWRIAVRHITIDDHTIDDHTIEDQDPR